MDTTPLFRADDDTPISATPNKSPEKRKEEDGKTFSELFSEALDSTPTQSHTPTKAFNPQAEPLAQASGFELHPSPVRQVQYSEEMDWSPSQPQHRAFREQQSPPKPFSQSPTQDGNPFWYKVPAAPTNPAHKLRNAPNKPLLRQQMVEKDSFSFRPTSRKGYEPKQAEAENNVSFKHPRFFAHEENDEASSLADLLTQSFSLKSDNQVSDDAVADETPSMWRVQTPGEPAPRQNYELLALMICLPGWMLVAWLSIYPLELQSVMLFVTGAVALNGTNNSVESAEEVEPSLWEAVLSALGVIELAAVCWVGWTLWKSEVDVTAYGAGVIGVVLLHQAAKSRNSG